MKSKKRPKGSLHLNAGMFSPVAHILATFIRQWESASLVDLCSLPGTNNFRRMVILKSH